METLGIAKRLDEEAKGRIKIWPAKSNRASSLGRPCIRYHVLRRTRWNEMRAHDLGLQRVFDEGVAQEKIVLQRLMAIGVEVLEQQRAFRVPPRCQGCGHFRDMFQTTAACPECGTDDWYDYQITGHIDGMVDDGMGYHIPLEIKSMSPWAFNTLYSAEDLVETMLAGPPHHQTYPPQLLLYMKFTGKPRGAWLFKEKLAGRHHDPVIYLSPHEHIIEGLLDKARVINDHIEQKTEPDPINDYSICSACGFNHICLPGHEGKQAIMDAELEWYVDEKRKREDSIRDVKAEIRALEDEIKERTKGREEMIISGKYRCVPRTVNVKPREGYSYTKYEFQNATE